MEWSSLKRWTRHVEVRLVSTLILLAAPVLGAVLFLFLTYAAHEMLEERGEALEVAADVAAADLAKSASAESLDPLFFDLLEREEIAVRLRIGDRLVASRGPSSWFEHQPRDSGAFWDAVRVGATDVLLASRLVGSRRIEMAASLRDFTKERGELMAGLWASLLVGLAGSALFAVVATRRALRPLHEATRAIQSLHAHHLGTRLAIRGSGDVVDQHAEALNRALDRIGEGFGRMRSFSANVAHELRTPIHRLLNLSGTQLIAHAEPDEAARSLLAVQETAEEMEATVEGLLLLAQADEGRLPLRIEEVSMADLLESLDELYRPACEEQSVALIVQAADVTLRIDPTLLIRALCNLVDNALGHTPPGGEVQVEAQVDPGFLTVYVRDTGKGIPKEHLERVFDRFYRIDPTERRRGAGLGLPISRAILRAMGGDLTAEPTSSGACFRVRLRYEGA